jgi:hypothetical protein
MPLTIPDRMECLILDLFGVIVTFDDRLVYDRIAHRWTSSETCGPPRTLSPCPEFARCSSN